MGHLITTVVGGDGKVWFKTKDVAKTLGYVCPKNAVLTHVRDKHKTTFGEIQGGTDSVPPYNTQPMTVFVSEPGLYSLIFRSHLPIAVAFQDWVFEEVLPSIRKTGSYTLPSALETIKSIDCNQLSEMDEEERREYKGIIKIHHNMIKDEKRVEMGRLGGKTTQKNIRQIRETLEKVRDLLNF